MVVYVRLLKSLWSFPEAKRLEVLILFLSVIIVNLRIYLTMLSSDVIFYLAVSVWFLKFVIKLMSSLQKSICSILAIVNSDTGNIAKVNQMCWNNINSKSYFFLMFNFTVAAQLIHSIQ